MKAKLASHIYITRDFELVTNWSDRDATVELTPVKYVCYQLLPADCPIRLRVEQSATKPKDFYDSCQTLAAAYQEEVSRAKVGKVQSKDAVMAKAKAARLKAGAEKARVARVAKAKANNKKRRVCLRTT